MILLTEMDKVYVKKLTKYLEIYYFHYIEITFYPFIYFVSHRKQHQK